MNKFSLLKYVTIIVIMILTPKIGHASFLNIGASLSLLSINDRAVTYNDRTYYASHSLFACYQYFPENIERTENEDPGEYMFCTLPLLLLKPYPWVSADINIAYNGDKIFYYPSVEAGIFYFNTKAGLGYAFHDELGDEAVEQMYMYIGYLLPPLSDGPRCNYLFELYVKLYFSDEGFYSTGPYNVGLKFGYIL